MNSVKIMGFIRHLLTLGGGYAVGKGFVDEETMLSIVGAAMSLIGFAWSYLAPEKAA